MTSSYRTAAWLAGACLLPFAAAAALVPVESWLTTSSVAVILVVPVVGIATSGRRWITITAAISAALSYDFFYTEPRRSFAIANVNDVVLVLSLLAVGLAVAELSLWGLRQRSTANRFVSDVTVLRSIAEMIAIGEDAESLAMSGAYWLRELLDLRDCRLARSDDPVSPAAITTTGEVLIGAFRWSPEHQGLPGPDIDLPLHAEGVVVGRFILTPTPGVLVAPDRLFTAVALADLVGSSPGFGRKGTQRAS